MIVLRRDLAELAAHSLELQQQRDREVEMQMTSAAEASASETQVMAIIKNVTKFDSIHYTCMNESDCRVTASLAAQRGKSLVSNSRAGALEPRARGGGGRV